ncbi:MAG: hypothetical protein M3Q39_09975 [Actinomycetota bacterium]|nr:hypothetical protein [Actinomycetota bacterium]
MIEGQYRLGDALWGEGTRLVIEDADLELPDLRNQDALNELGHGAVPGRDRLGTSLWVWELATDADDFENGPEHAGALFDDLAAAWRQGVHAPPGQLFTLTYGAFGRTRQVYGRPDRITPPKPNYLGLVGQARGAIAFRVLDPLVYTEQMSTLELSQVTVSDGGAAWPITWPLEFSRSTTTRQGIVHVDGVAPVPFRIAVRGPNAGVASQISLTGPGWAIDCDVPVPFDKTLLIDTREMTAVLSGGGGSAAAGLSRRSRLSARLAPGNSEITFTCADPTMTALATVSWQAGWYSV